jgi:hypothetical protein
LDKAVAVEMDIRVVLHVQATFLGGAQPQSGAMVQLVALQHWVRFLLPAAVVAADLNQAA